MNVTLSTDNPRSLKALRLAAGAAEWLVLPDGRYGIPSQRHSGAYYAASTLLCSCPDAQFSRETCKHQLAVRLYAVIREAA